MPNRFLEGFLKSWGVILASEIGDKTFFIAAVMAMRNSRKQVCLPALQSVCVEIKEDAYPSVANLANPISFSC